MKSLQRAQVKKRQWVKEVGKSFWLNWSVTYIGRDFDWNDKIGLIQSQIIGWPYMRHIVIPRVCFVCVCCLFLLPSFVVCVCVKFNVVIPSHVYDDNSRQYRCISLMSTRPRALYDTSNNSNSSSSSRCTPFLKHMF